MNNTAVWAYALTSLLAPAMPAFAQNASAISAKEIKRLECMVSVVRAAPNTDRARYEIHDGRPYLRWHYKKGEVSTDISFSGIQALDGTWQYTGAFGGIFDGIHPPDVFGADKIEKLWKSKCGVDAMMMFI